LKNTDASMVLWSWDREDIINMVDGQLKRPAKEETILMGGKMSQRYAKTRDRPPTSALCQGLVIVADYYTS
jgi:hypothetical protein